MTDDSDSRPDPRAALAGIAERCEAARVAILAYEDLGCVTDALAGPAADVRRLAGVVDRHLREAAPEGARLD